MDNININFTPERDETKKTEIINQITNLSTNNNNLETETKISDNKQSTSTFNINQ